MLDVLWTSLGLFSQPKETFEELKAYRTKALFMNGFMISIIGVLSLFLGEMLGQGSVAPHTVFFQLIAYYISSYLFLSIVLFGVSFFHRKINMLQFLGLYLTTDIVLLMVLPLALLGFALPTIAIVFKISIYIVVFIAWLLKVRLFMTYFKLSVSQVIVMYSLPTILLIALGIMLGLTFFNTAITLF